MNKAFIFVMFFYILLLSGCAAKDMKKYGGNLALNSSGGHPITTGVGLVIGGTSYSIGTLVEEKDNQKEK